MAAPLTREEIARRWPSAVAIARQYRAVFGDGVRLKWARNAAGEVLGKKTGS